MLIYAWAFLIFSSALVLVSWASLRNWRSHGFYRFLSWEVLLALIMLNARYWFEAPFALRQIISWFLLAASLYLITSGFLLLRAIGKPQGAFENTTELVTIGIYRTIRHPMYASLLFLGAGAFLKHPTPLSFLLAGAAGVFMFLTARVEEAENLIRFGEPYRAYMKHSKMFIPFLL